MNRLKALAISSCLGLLALAFLPSSRADEWNKKTILTVNEPLAIPGTVLQPGKYVIKLADSQSNRHIVQVFNEDESKLQTTILAIPNYRLQPTGETQFGFWESAAGQPRALKAWFYPGDNFGQEFAYPKEMASQIARASNENVPAIVSEGTDVRSAEVKEITPSGEAQEMSRTEQSTTTTAQAQPSTTQPETATQPQTPTTAQSEQSSVRTGTGEPSSTTAQQPSTTTTESQTAQTQPQTSTAEQSQAQPSTAAQPAEPSAQPSATAAEQQQLPRTASPMPLVGLAGLLSLGAAVGVRVLSRLNG